MRFLWMICLLVACVDTDDLRTDRTRETPSTPDTGGGDWPPPIEEGHCENGSLSYGPLPLPPAVKGRPYEARVSEWADDDWWGTSYRGGGSLPPGLALEGDEKYLESLVIRGVPTESGHFQVHMSAGHAVDSNGCSTMPDPHTFDLEIYETEAQLDAGSEGGNDDAGD